MRNLSLKSTLFLAVALGLAGSMASCDNDEPTPKDRYSIELSSDNLHFTEEGGNSSLTLSTNSQWEVNTSSDWVSFVPTQSGAAADKQTITVTALPFSEENSSRTTVISIKCGDISTDAVVRKFITVSQDGPVVEDREPGIYSLKDLTELGEAIASATVEADPDYSKWQDENGVINLYNDINAGATPLPLMGGQDVKANDKSGAFGGIFDGNGHTISGRLESGGQPIVALFTRLAPTGIIRNLTVDVEATNDYTGSVQKHLAAIVGFSVTATSGYIENCTSKGTLTMTGSTTNPRVGGIVAYGRCNITGCSNYADIVSNSNRVAGINGAGGGAFTISDCKNYGTIRANCDAAQVGGIIGQLNGQTILGCENHGDITLTGGGKAVVGGIAGNSQGSSSIGSAESPCLNKGVITINGAETAPVAGSGVGGISGGMSAAVPIAYATNEGAVVSNIDDSSVAAGGIVGAITKAAPLTGCQNKASVTSAANAGGIVGSTTVATEINACGNTGDIVRLATATVPAAWFGGIAGQAPSAVLTNCTFGGTVLGAPGDNNNATGTAAR